MPSSLLQQAEDDFVPHLLAERIVDDIAKGELSSDQLHKVGRTVSAFYVKNLPDELQSLAKQQTTSTVSSSQLMQALFAEEFRTNIGWATAKTLYANAASEIAKDRKPIGVGDIDEQYKLAMKEKFKDPVEDIVRSLFGNRAGIKNSPLPERVVRFLVDCDQRFHKKLMEGPKTRDLSSQQMRDARVALQKQLLVTYLLQPMVCNLGAGKPQQKEIWLQSQLLQTMLDALPPLSNAVLAQSYAQSRKEFQEAVTQKDALERQKKIIDARQNTLRAGQRNHQRSRSADTPLVDSRTLLTRQQMIALRAQQRKDPVLKQFGSDIRALEEQMVDFDNVLNDAKKSIEEREAVNTGREALQTFTPRKRDKVLSVLDAPAPNVGENSPGTVGSTLSVPLGTLTTTTQVTAPITLTTTTATTVTAPNAPAVTDPSVALASAEGVTNS